jgi:hypothetical protein
LRNWQSPKPPKSRVLTHAGLTRLSDLEPAKPVQSFEHAKPGDLIHIHTTKLGRIEGPGNRATGYRRDRSRGAGWEAVDDHARIAYTELYPDESQESSCHFLANAHAYYCSLGAKPQRLLPAANQRQGRAFHPVGATRVGLRLLLQDIERACRNSA